MRYTQIDPRPVDCFSPETQEALLWDELDRFNQTVPLKVVIAARQQSMAEHGTPYHTPYDLFMWNIVGDPYCPTGRILEQSYAGIGTVQLGERLFSGLSEDGEILHVSGKGDTTLQNHPGGYSVHTLHLLKGQSAEWFVKGVEAPTRPTFPLHIGLQLGRSALSLVGAEEEPLQASFTWPSPHQGSLSNSESGEPKILYDRDLLKNLYTVVKAFDQKYRHLVALYGRPFEPVVDTLSAAIIGM